jgi:hypothetical protein
LLSAFFADLAAGFTIGGLGAAAADDSSSLAKRSTSSASALAAGSAATAVDADFYTED